MLRMPYAYYYTLIITLRHEMDTSHAKIRLMIHDYVPVFVSLTAMFVFALAYSYLQDAVRQRASKMSRPSALVFTLALYASVFLLIGLIFYLLSVGVLSLMHDGIFNWLHKNLIF